MGNDALMIRLFVELLKGIAINWFRTLSIGSIKFWIHLEARFLTCIYEDDTEVSMPTLIKEKQKKCESMKFVD